MEDSVYLTKEQVIKAFEKIEPLLTGSVEEDELSMRVAHLEEKLLAEQIRKKQLEHKVAATTESDKNWRAMWMHLKEGYDELKDKFERIQSEYSQSIMELRCNLDQSESDLARLRGETLDDLDLNELASLEKEIMSSLKNLQTLKQETIQNMIKKEVSTSYLCVVCRKNFMDVLVRPCQHISLCEKCLPSVTRCPICCCTIDSVVKIFLTKY